MHTIALYDAVDSKRQLSLKICLLFSNWHSKTRGANTSPQWVITKTVQGNRLAIIRLSKFLFHRKLSAWGSTFSFYVRKVAKDWEDIRIYRKPLTKKMCSQYNIPWIKILKQCLQVHLLQSLVPSDEPDIYIQVIHYIISVIQRKIFTIT